MRCSVCRVCCDERSKSRRNPHFFIYTRSAVRAPFDVRDAPKCPRSPKPLYDRVRRHFHGLPRCLLHTPLSWALDSGRASAVLPTCLRGRVPFQKRAPCSVERPTEEMPPQSHSSTYITSTAPTQLITPPQHHHQGVSCHHQGVSCILSTHSLNQ